MMSSDKPTSADRKRARARSGLLRRIVLYAAVSAVFVLLAMAMWPKPQQVEAAAIRRGPLTVSVLEEGKTRIRRRYTISSPVSGFLNRVPLRAGAPIEAGKTLLAVVESVPSGFLDARTLAQGEARVKSAEGTRLLRESELARTSTSLELARKEFARIDALLKTRSVSREEWDTAENRMRLLSRELDSSQFSVRVAQFEVELAKSALSSMKTLEGRTSESLRILAPVDGFVLSVQEESARTIAAGAPIMEVGDPHDLEAEIELLSSDAVAVAPGADVSIEQWGGEKPLRGRVSVVERGGFTKISALGVEEQRVLVRVDFVDPVPPGHILGDRFRVEARIVTWHGEDILQIPTGALFRRGGDWSTFLIEGGKAHLRKVIIGHNNGTAAEVVSGLKEGQNVILHPADSIAEGKAVRIDAAGDTSSTTR